MSEKIKTILLTGFLGAGKTTLLNKLLAHPAFAADKKAVLINDFGKLPVDGAQIKNRNVTIAEINSGSIFCVCVKAPLIEGLNRIAADVCPDVLFIEATGLAEPRDVSALLQTKLLREKYELPQAIAVVDALNYPKLSTILTALNAQVRIADTVIINKCDLVAPRQVIELENAIRKLNPGAQIFNVEHCRLPENTRLFKAAEYSCACDNETCDCLSLCSERPVDTETVDFETDAIIDRQTFNLLVEKYSNELLRGKGLLDFGDGLEFIDIVNGEIAIKPDSEINFSRSAHCAASFIIHSLTPEIFLAELNAVHMKK